MRNYSDPFNLVLILILAAYIFHLIFDLVSLVLLSNKYYELGFAFIFHIPSNICPYEMLHNTNYYRFDENTFTHKVKYLYSSQISMTS